ncbi:MAG TPA: tyrosine-type recombinase/integrase [Candidatus Krumholzibacteria bacterium]
MTLLAPHLVAFIRDYLPGDRGCSEHTCAAYAYTFQLFLQFAAERSQVTPSSLTLEQLDAPLVVAFLEHLETVRGNSATTRNARLAAIKSFAHFLEYRDPSCLAQVGAILAIPSKKSTQPLIDYLDREEIQALLDSPDPSTREGTRDRAMLHIAFAAGLRVSELIGLQRGDVKTHPQPSIHVCGKGRRERVLPLWKETAKSLGAWMAVRGEPRATEVFLNAQGESLTRSGFEYILRKYVKVAAQACPSIAVKRVSPHVLRHSCAMHTLHATRDVRQVALWLGHASVQSTEVYLRADPSEKLAALGAGTAPSLRPGCFKAPDRLVAMLRPS